MAGLHHTAFDGYRAIIKTEATGFYQILQNSLGTSIESSFDILFFH